MTLPLLLAVALSASAAPQPPRDARLLVTVVDPSGAVIPAATVTVAGAEEATKAAGATAKTSDKGVATLEGLTPGRYAIQAEFAGFEPGLLKDVRLRGGDNKHVVVLSIERVRESVSVAQDAQIAAADPRGNSFKTTLTADELDALSGDPAEMAQQLQDLAGGNAVIRVDSFLGRNTVRSDSQWTWNASAAYTLRLGVRPAAQERDRDRRGDGPEAPATRYRLTFNLNITNLTNRANYTGFSGVMTSPFFERPTAVANPRKVDFGMSFGF
jgi:Carboxypeptidase regulatory-like domain